MSSQHMEALARANEIRLSMSAIRNEISTLNRYQGMARCAELLENPSQIVGAMRLDYLICSCNRTKDRMAIRLLVHAGLRPSRMRRRVRELTLRERAVLCKAMREIAGAERGEEAA